MTTVEQFIEWAERTGSVCTPYMRRLAAASGKSDTFRVLCDVNGGAWLFEMHANGVQVPIGDFIRKYRNHLDGKVTVNYPNGYTSKMYCRHYGGGIVADTTLVYLLECKGAKVAVPMNKYPTVVLSHGSDAEITMGAGSRLNVELYGDAKYTLLEGDMTKVRVTRH